MVEPSDDEREANRARADEAQRQLLEEARRRWSAWAPNATFDHLIIGGGLAATLDWATLGLAPEGCAVVADGPDPWWSRGQWRMGQPASELVSEAFVLQPHDFDGDVDGYAPASAIGRAIALTAHEHRCPMVLGATVRQPIRTDSPLEVTVGGQTVTARRVDIAVGPGPARRLRDRGGGATIVSPADEQELITSGRMVFGQDQWKHPVLGSRVLVYGGGATAAWNVEYARRTGASVYWYAGGGTTPPGLMPAKVRQIEQRLARGGLDGERERWLRRMRERLLAFHSADLPRNRDVFADEGVEWSMAELRVVRPHPEGVEVVSHHEAGEQTLVVDQIVVSIGQDSGAPRASASIMPVHQVGRIEHDGRGPGYAQHGAPPRGRVVGVCDRADDPRIRCLGATLRDVAWRSKLTSGLTSGDRVDLEAILVEQAQAAPTHSRGVPGAVFQVAANVVLANGQPLDQALGEERWRLLTETMEPS